MYFRSIILSGSFVRSAVTRHLKMLRSRQTAVKGSRSSGNATPAADHARRRPHHRRRHGNFCPANERVPPRSRLRSMAWACSATHSTGSKARLGKTSKMGQRDIRRLLIIGAMAVVKAAVRRGVPCDTDGVNAWLSRMLAKKPRMLVAIALANKMARGLWAMMTKEQNYRDPAVTAA